MGNRSKTCIRCDAPLAGKGGFKRLCDTCKREWKWCPRCEALKPLAAFGSGAGYCKNCMPGYNAERNALASEKDTRYRAHLKRQHGIGDDEARRLAAVTACEACGREPESGQRLNVDHDHQTGAVRGVLCYWCNQGAALLEDEPRLAALRRYLHRHGLRAVS